MRQENFCLTGPEGYFDFVLNLVAFVRYYGVTIIGIVGFIVLVQSVLIINLWNMRQRFRGRRDGYDDKGYEMPRGPDGMVMKRGSAAYEAEVRRRSQIRASQAKGRGARSSAERPAYAADFAREDAERGGVQLSAPQRATHALGCEGSGGVASQRSEVGAATAAVDPPARQNRRASQPITAEAVGRLVEMGFAQRDVITALATSGGDPDRAYDKLVQGQQDSPQPSPAAGSGGGRRASQASKSTNPAASNPAGGARRASNGWI